MTFSFLVTNGEWNDEQRERPRRGYGCDQPPYLTGSVKDSPRDEFIYYGESSLYAIRFRNWKIRFQVKDDWFAGHAVQPTVPQPVNLRADPFEQHMQAPDMQATAKVRGGN